MVAKLIKKDCYTDRERGKLHVKEDRRAFNRVFHGLKWVRVLFKLRDIKYSYDDVLVKLIFLTE